MTIVSNTFLTYSAVGNREDLEDAIYLIDDFETPFISTVEKIKADAKLHEWQTDAIRDAASNQQLEGDDISTFDAVTATTRLGNRCQISRETAIVSGTQEAVKKAGRKSEMAHQLYKKSVALMHDMELDALANNAKVTGNSTTASEAAGLEAWITTNDDFGGSGASPTGDGSDARTNGTARDLTEALVSKVARLCYNQGGKPDTILCSPFIKQQISKTFTGFNTRNVDMTSSKKLNSAVDVYVTDFGTLRIRPDRFVRSGDATRTSLYMLQMDMWAIAELRPFRIEALAKTGDAEKKMLVTEWTLVARNEKASGGVFDLTPA